MQLRSRNQHEHWMPARVELASRFDNVNATLTRIIALMEAGRRRASTWQRKT